MNKTSSNRIMSKKQENISLFEIHKNLLQHELLPFFNKVASLKENGSTNNKVSQQRQNYKLHDELSALMQQKAYLQSEISRIQGSSVVCTVQEDLENKILLSNEINSSAKRPYINSFDKGCCVHQQNIEYDALKLSKNSKFVSEEKSNLIDKMSRIRERKRISAAHRCSSGISSLFICDEDSNNYTLGARIDVCDFRGVFVATHYCFFTVVQVEEKSSNNLKQNTFRLRMIQNNLPHSVSVRNIIERYFPCANLNSVTSSYDMVEWNEEDEGESSFHVPPQVFQSLRSFIGELYDACYSYATRSFTCRKLKQLSLKDPASIILNVSYNDAFDLLSLEINSYSLLRIMCVQITYEDQLSTCPTHVHLVWEDEEVKLPRVKRKKTDFYSSHDDMYRDKEEQVISFTKDCFQSYHLVEAVEIVQRYIDALDE